ncbi:MAG: hypothetical protein KF764_07285 [Labilithrix sp.]|nr:hypothetical protein [Labilithrix sp.]
MSVSDPFDGFEAPRAGETADDRDGRSAAARRTRDGDPPRHWWSFEGWRSANLDAEFVLA